MTIAKYLDSIDGTDKEPILFKGMGKLTKEEGIAALMDKPGVGDLFCALAELGNSESIAEFKQTVHYDAIKDWGISVFDLEKGSISIYPGPKHLKKFFTVVAIAGAGIYLWKLHKKHKAKLKVQ